MNDIKEQF